MAKRKGKKSSKRGTTKRKGSVKSKRRVKSTPKRRKARAYNRPVQLNVRKLGALADMFH